MPSDDTILKILNGTRTIALVGASNKPDRPSYGVMQFLLSRGYRVMPVNPGLAGQTIHAQRVLATLGDLPEKPDMVDIFRRSEEVGPIVEQAIALGAKSIWMQLGVINDEAAAKARKAGLDVVMDHCPAIEIPRLGARITGPATLN